MIENSLHTIQDVLNRRVFLRHGSAGLGAAALASLLTESLSADSRSAGGLAAFPNFVPPAKRIIYLFQSGAPSQMDLFDPRSKTLNSGAY